MKNLIFKTFLLFLLFFGKSQISNAQSFIDYSITNNTSCTITITFETSLGNYPVTVAANTTSTVGCNAFNGTPLYVKVDDSLGGDYHMPPQSGGTYPCTGAPPSYAGNCGGTCVTPTSTGSSSMTPASMGACNGGIGSGRYIFTIVVNP
jgi:hypothetical protein